MDKIDKDGDYMNWDKLKVWFVAGSQFLYGEETLKQVEEDSIEIVDYMNSLKILPFEIKYIDVVKTTEDAKRIVKEANYADECIGVMAFCHTFSPSKMWINGLDLLQKPYLHYHTQYLDTIPYEDIDMDYMNLHQSAHGDREHAFMTNRLGIPRKIVVGHWKDKDTLHEIDEWMRAAAGAAYSKQLSIIRFGDNMREVGVTEGDKVLAQEKLGWQVNTWPVGDLVEVINNVDDEEVDKVLNRYKENYNLATENIDSVKYQAKVQVAINKMLDENSALAFTDTFEDLHGLKQLPGIAAQDLMAQGYGFGAEGDWKTSGMLAILKYMSTGLNGGNTFIEDYTYDINEGLALGAHMLEVCPTVAESKPEIEVHPLDIGDREDPARLVFKGKEGKATLTTLIDMGGRLRLIVQDINVVKQVNEMPNMPVATVMWKPEPNLKDGTLAWMLCGGAHHSVLSYDISPEVLKNWANMMKIEFIYINEETDLDALERDLAINDVVWRLKNL